MSRRKKRKYNDDDEEVPVNFCPLPNLDPATESRFCDRSYEMLRAIENLLNARRGFARSNDEHKKYWHEIYLGQFNTLERLYREVKGKV